MKYIRLDMEGENPVCSLCHLALIFDEKPGTEVISVLPCQSIGYSYAPTVVEIFFRYRSFSSSTFSRVRTPL